VSCLDAEDTWRWKCTTTCNFSFATAWELVRGAGIKFDLADIVLYPFNSPKMSMCLLRAMKGKLLTRAFLKSIRITDNEQCALCSSGQENIQHLSFQCPYSAYIWTLCRLKLGIPGPIRTLQEGANLLKEKFNKKCKSSILAKLTFAAAVWHIWKERNHRIFQLQENHKTMVFRRLYEDVN